MTRKKLIEVALPLDAINREAAREKSIRHGHPSTLHLWWARRPLAACRAVLFASLVDDPSSRPDEFPTVEQQDAERQRLFTLIEELVKWENSNDKTILTAARKEIERSCDGDRPPVLDPFCGGGSIPLEAQRLGLEAHASDLNPVAVVITKALVEIPPRFAGRAPVHPRDNDQFDVTSWSGAQGLAGDVRHYGDWMRDEAERRIGKLYPKVQLPPEHGGGETTVIAWIWARTVPSPNPAWDGPMPLVRSFALSTKKGKETWVEPVVDRGERCIHFEVRQGKGAPTGTVNRSGARCLATDTAVPFSYVREQGQAGNMGVQLMAIVAEGNSGRIYLSPNEDHERLALSIEPPDDVPDADLPNNPRDFKTPNYGMRGFSDLFTARQLTALCTFSALVQEVRPYVEADAIAVGLDDDRIPFRDGGSGATAYADAVATYLAFAVDKLVDRCSTLCAWEPRKNRLRGTFQRQALPMSWDFVEANVFGNVGGDLSTCLFSLWEVMQRIPDGVNGQVKQLDAIAIDVGPALVSTDPPYYDNIGYADLSDFFYVWLRRSLDNVWPHEFSTLLTPKGQELVATPYRHGSKEAAEDHFESGLESVFARLHKVQDEQFPATVYYAFKQAERRDGELASTGWETMLEALIAAGFAINGTWPMRSELSNRMLAAGTNALASSIVLVCRPLLESAPLATRKEFVAELRAQLPEAVRLLQTASIAPVDLAQSAIGPGMKVFTGYSKVVEADGSAMTVRSALGLINEVLDETLAEQEGAFDPDTRWAVTWFGEHSMQGATYGEAETLARAKNVSVDGLVLAGILESRAGKVRLLAREEMHDDWDPSVDGRPTVWELAQHLIRGLETDGEGSAANLLRRVGGWGETGRELAYRLFSICSEKGWTDEAIHYNALVVAWPEISRIAAGVTPETVVQASLET